MQKKDGVYLVDRLDGLTELESLGPNFAKALAFIRRGGLDRLAIGRHEIDGASVYVNADVASLVRPEERRPELHRRYFDIHVPLDHEEMIGLAALDPAAEGAFDEEHDVGFYSQPVEWFAVRPGECVVTWPGTCVHAPACTRGEPREARKLVFKIVAE